MDSRTFDWQFLTELEPRLLDIERDIRRVSPSAFRREGFDRVWVFPFKQRMVELVGWERKPGHVILSSSGAYDLAMDHLLAELEKRWERAA